MKCNSCQMNWNDDGKFSNVEKCPFCGNILHNEKKVFDDNISFGSVLKEIEKRCGKEIWKDRTKAVSVFTDLAPGMKKERILLVLALESQIQDVFEREKEFAVSKAKIQLLDSLGERPIEEILLAFSDLNNIEVDKKLINTVVKANSNNNYDNIKFGEEISNNASKFKEKTFVQNTTDSKNNSIQGNSFADLKVGDIFDFGKFEGRKIKWKVLKKEEDSFYVISTEILCNRVFNSNYLNNWSESELKKWLNRYFLKCSFSYYEQIKIKPENSESITLLSKEEAESLMTKEERSLNFWWWLRSPYPGYNGGIVWSVRSDGDVDSFNAYSSGGVRPALHIYL